MDTKYRILVVANNRANITVNTVYKFYTEKNAEGEAEIYETSDLDELDAKIEELLNGDYLKKNLTIVSVVDYTIDAIIDAE